MLREVVVAGLTMTYREVGVGDPVLFLHGNPTSSYLWRQVLPLVQDLGRCVAPDLIGMGGSQKLPAPGAGSYRLVEHRRYLDAMLELLAVRDRVVLVGHDWGGVLAVDWARRHPDAVRGVAYMETLVAPVTSDGPNAPDPELFSQLRSPAGEELVLRHDVFVEQVLQAGTLRSLTEDEMQVYRRPYAEPGESRRPTLTWAREIPIDGTPTDVHDVVSENARWMGTTPVPKLFVNGRPGALLTADLRALCRQWPEQREVTVRGVHFLPEDSPQEIGTALADWIRQLP